MKVWKHVILIAVVAITVLSLLLSACGPIDNSNGNSKKDKDKGNSKDNDEGGNADKITICHKTGSAKKPYVMINVSVNATAEGHGTHAGDLIPAPEDGCPATANENSNDNDSGDNADKIIICHRTGSAKNPYVEITVSTDATTEGHGTHAGDLIPVPENGCPGTVTATE